MRAGHHYTFRSYRGTDLSARERIQLQRTPLHFATKSVRVEEASGGRSRVRGCNSITSPFRAEVGILFVFGFLPTQYTLIQCSVLIIRSSFALTGSAREIR